MKIIALAIPIALIIALALAGFVVTLLAIIDILRDQDNKKEDE
jgi:hypothetical protein